MDNPFNTTFGIAPNNYINRIKESQKIIDDFSSESPSNYVYLITGLRGCGKTVLLSSIADKFNNDDNWIVVDPGPKDNILENIASEIYEVGKLKKLPGIGPKTAQRIILELKDKLKAVEDTNKGELEEMLSKKEADSEKVSEAMSALQVLGYTRKEIEKAFEMFEKAELSVEDIIKKGLFYLAK